MEDWRLKLAWEENEQVKHTVSALQQLFLRFSVSILGTSEELYRKYMCKCSDNDNDKHYIVLNISRRRENSHLGGEDG